VQPRRTATSSPRTPSPTWSGRTEYWLGQQGRITEPMVRRPGAAPTTTPIAWDDALATDRRATCAGLDQPRPGDLLHLRQDLQRGRVRLPALRPGLRHQQPARLLQHVPRVDLRVRAGPTRSASARARSPSRTSTTAELILVAGQNPGTNHPRMLSALEEAKSRRRPASSRSTRSSEAGPRPLQATPRTSAVGSPTAPTLADLHLPVRLNGDLALLPGRRRPPHRPRRGRPRRSSTEHADRPRGAHVAHLADLDWAEGRGGPPGSAAGPDHRGGRG
jgi:hypothetical protein